MLRRVPWWGWFLGVLVTLMAAYNPWGGSVWHLWTGGAAVPLPVRLLLTFLVSALIGLLCAATWKSIGLVGVLLMASLVALLLWIAVAYGALDPRSSGAVHVLPQVVGAALLTVGLRWPSFRRQVSGVVAVSDQDTEHHH